jgi:hypothetical protein
VLSTADMQSVLAAQDRTIIRETQFTFYMNWVLTFELYNI